MPERAGRILINVNSLYGSTSPTPENFDEYWRKLQNQLPSDIEDKNIVMEGTAPPWLFCMLLSQLQHFTNKISILVTKGGVTFEYIVHGVDATKMKLHPRKVV
jgi:hypothetical protein